jgi:hypothetical protein
LGGVREARNSVNICVHLRSSVANSFLHFLDIFSAEASKAQGHKATGRWRGDPSAQMDG